MKLSWLPLVIVVVWLALLPLPASARHFGHRPIVVRPEPSVFPKTIDPWKLWGVPLRKHHVVHHSHSRTHGALNGRAAARSHGSVGTFFPVVSGPTVVVLAPPVSAPPSVVYVAPPPVANLVPEPPSRPTVVEHPTGRYELRGDGMTAPYRWVWIPNPPGEPPPAPGQTPSLDPSVPSPSMPPAAPRPPAARSEVYRWADDEGVAHWTNKLEKIPAPYRSRAERLI
jgi:hypothetical protein